MEVTSLKHFIIVKFKDSLNFNEFVEPIKKLFNKALKIEGVDKVDIYPSNTNLPNRYDLMIRMELTSKALIEFDNSGIHKLWKSEYGKYIVDKTIFDCN